MTETEKKALALLNEICVEMGLDKVRSLELNMPGERALLRAIEQHEAYKREVSDAVVAFRNEWVQATPSRQWFQAKFTRFIIVKPDPLVEAWLEAFPGNHITDAREECAKISAALAARGLEVRKIGEGA